MRGMNPLPLLVILLMGVVFVGACKDSPTEPAQPLNEEEAEALFVGLFDFLSDSTAEPISETENGGVYACARGGEMAVTIDFSQEVVGDTFRRNSDLVLDPDGCVIWSEGYQFTLDGNPNARIDMAFSTVGQSGSFVLDMSITGGLDWRLDDRSGTCIFDLSGGGTFDPSNIDAPEAGMTGTVCGLELDFDSLQPPG